MSYKFNGTYVGFNESDTSCFCLELRVPFLLVVCDCDSTVS